MESQNVERRLTTILAADVAGYSRLMGADEAGTLAALKSHRKELIEPKAAQYQGRTVKLMGDGALMEFTSVVGAVLFAIEVQCAMRERNAQVPEDRRIVYRLGVNIGDIIVDGDDIYGDGVNVAAHLEGLAEPGGICISRPVHTQIVDKLDLEFEDLGKQEVKNIAKPVMVYRVALDQKAAALVTPIIATPASIGRGHWPQIAAALAVLLIVAGGVLWWRPWAFDVEPAAVEKMALPLPDKPSIAVLPFDNLSGDPEQSYFTDGMTDDLITGLSKLSGLFVISRNSTFTYKDTPVKVRQVAEELGVRYVLEGSVRRVGDHVRVNAQLIDAVSGFHLWAEKYDGALTDIFALQDKVVGQIVTALAVNLTSSESARSKEAETAVPEAYDALLQGWDHYHRQTPDDYAKAITFFNKAIERDPGYSRAYAGLAGVYWRIADWGWASDIGIEWQFALDQAKHYLDIALERPTSDAYWISAEMLKWQGRHEEALAKVDQAISLAPNDAGNYVTKAWILIASGQAEEAEKNARMAMRLNPSYRPSYLRVLGYAYFHQERYAEAAEVLERAVSRLPDFEYAYRYLAATYGHLGRLDDAKAAVLKHDEIVMVAGGTPLTVQEIGIWVKYKDKAYLERFREGLRKAGVPEGATTAIDVESLITESGDGFDVEGATAIDAATAKSLSERGVLFVDVRSKGSYGEGHIPEAAHLDLHTDLNEENLSRLIEKDVEVVFYCFGRSCYRSAHACAKAISWGFTKVYYFAGGFPAWKGAGYAIATE